MRGSSFTKAEADKFEEFCNLPPDPPLRPYETIEDRATILWEKWKCLTDLFYLGSEVLGWNTSKKGRRRRVDPSFHRWLAGVLEKEGDKLILVPRQHLKTTWVKAAIIQRILQNPNVRIGLFSSTASLVEAELASIKLLLTTKRLRQLFPEVIPDPGKDYRGWEISRADELTMKRDRSKGFVPQEPQIFAAGVGANITGKHFDEAFFDDIVTDQTVTTAEQMEKVERWWTYMQPILEIDAQVTFTGTFYHHADLYNQLIRGKQIERFYIRRCIENGRPLYKSWLSLKDLEKMRKRMSQYEWNCQMMLDPDPVAEKILPPPYPVFDKLPPGTYKYYIAVDPAATTKAYSDKTGIVIGAVNEINHLFIVEALGVKLPGNKLVELLIQKCIQYDPVRVGIELGLQEHLVHIVDLMLKEYEQAHRCYIAALHRIMPIPISRNKTKAQRIATSLGAFLRENKCRIKDDCKMLMAQMEFFTGSGKEEDDVVDAASMLFSCVETFAQHYWIDPQFRKSGMSILERAMQKKESTWEGQFVHGAA